ncbi:MAG: hypothetical protein JNG84_01650 [Archangium sp.]|nr:hypothetical protein [Archangium sp.]
MLGVNLSGHEAGNADFVMGRALPLLQDTPQVDAWNAWHTAWRDVVVLDASNAKRGVLNLTSHDLTVPANFAALKQLLLDAR